MFPRMSLHFSGTAPPSLIPCWLRCGLPMPALASEDAGPGWISFPANHFKNWLSLQLSCGTSSARRLNSAHPGVGQRRRDMRKPSHTKTEDTAQFSHRFAGKEIRQCPSMQGHRRAAPGLYDKGGKGRGGTDIEKCTGLNSNKIA
jgi:hypothetical protein